MSDCEQIAERIFHSKAELSSQEAAELEGHCAKCPECMAKLDDLEETARLVPPVPEIDDARWSGVWDNVEKRGLAAPLWAGIRGVVLRAVTVTAAAAAVLVAAYLVFPDKPAGIVDAPDAAGTFELVSLEVESPDYNVIVMTDAETDVPVIWLERI